MAQPMLLCQKPLLISTHVAFSVTILTQPICSNVWYIQVIHYQALSCQWKI